jgi:general secretion pathway protein I
MPAADRTAGFTLLEVLIALAIAGLSLVLLFRAGADGLVAVDTARRAEEAVQRAQSHLAALGNQGTLTAGETEGDDGGGYRWRVRVNPVAAWPAASIGSGGNRSGAAGPYPLTLYDVEVAVVWRGRHHDRSVVLKTQRLTAMPRTEGSP